MLQEPSAEQNPEIWESFKDFASCLAPLATQKAWVERNRSQDALIAVLHKAIRRVDEMEGGDKSLSSPIGHHSGQKYLYKTGTSRCPSYETLNQPLGSGKKIVRAVKT